MRQPLLKLQNITRSFPSGDGEVVDVLKDINLTIYDGEMIAIVGPSGCGKSTLMNLLGCLDSPSNGRYYITGREVKMLTKDELAELRREYFGFIFQRYHLLSNLTAIENIEIPAIYAGISKVQRQQRARHLLDQLGLPEKTNYRPGQLSGGQQQRVSIARALMNGGKIILADEPTGALDSKHGKEVMQILSELHQKGHTIILITHDLQLAQTADRIIQIQDGAIINDTQNNKINTEISSVSPQPSRKNSLLSNKWGNFIEGFKMAWRAMVTHRMRTSLTMLGIIIGIASVVSIIAIADGAKKNVIANIDAYGINTVSVYPHEETGSIFRSNQSLTLADVASLSQQYFIDSSSPVMYSARKVRYKNAEETAEIKGTGEQYFRILDLKLSQGVPFRTNDVLHSTQTVVINQKAYKKLFLNHENPIGKTILIDLLPCRVVGVIKANEKGSQDQKATVLMPYSTFQARLAHKKGLSLIMFRIRDNFSLKVADQVISKQLFKRHHRKDFESFNTDTITENIQKITSTLTLLIASIALISLIVGGIGVMNIMLVSVTERIREIGIRMAVGARQSDILQQFLMEAILICLMGGFIGIILSFIIGMLFNSLSTSFKMDFSVMSIIMACCCSTFIGVLFGFLPARNAAKLDPAVTLMSD